MNNYHQNDSVNRKRIILLDGSLIDCLLKPEHQLVWQALESGNEVWNRVVNVNEVIESLTINEIRHLQKVYVKELKSAVAVVLELLSKRGLVFIKNNGKRRYYGSLRLLKPNICEVPEAPESRRQSILKLIYKTVEKYKRPVRSEDLLTFTEEEYKSVPVDKLLVVRDLRNLCDTGELQIVNTIHGDGGGRNLYLPSELNPNDYVWTNSITWLDFVSEAFETIWKTNCSAAENEGTLPRPIATAEIRHYLESSSEPHYRLKEPKAVTNALKTLSEGRKASIKRIKARATGAVLWIPIEISNKEISVFGGIGDDSNKIAAAVERAEAKLERPVTATDIRKEIKADADLLPNSNQTIARLLSETSKLTISDGYGGRKKRVTCLVQNVGCVDGKSYYVSSGQDIEKAKVYIKYLNCKSVWKNFTAVENITAIENCQLFSVKRGRMLLLQKETNVIRLNLLKLFSNERISSDLRRSIESLLRETELTAANAEQWLYSNPSNNLPVEIKNDVAGLTAEELLTIYRPLYPAAADIKIANRLITLCKSNIRRFSNNKFTSRFSSESAEAAEYLFDRTDALMHAGIRWGGNECRYQALTAKSELGLLRDMRFILPELKSGSFEKRLVAVACLSFLQTEQSNKKLYYILENDRINNVRYSAMWSMAFTQGSSVLENIGKLTENDNNINVRELGEIIAKSKTENIWFL